MVLRGPSLLESKKIPDLARRAFHFEDNTFLEQLMYFLVNQRIFILLKRVARKPVLLRLSRELNTDSQHIRQNYMIIILSFHAAKGAAIRPTLKLCECFKRQGKNVLS